MIISITNQKGGSGKSTTAALVALSQSAQGKKVLCIDTDPQGGLTSFLTGKEPEQKKGGLFDIVIGGDPAPETIEREGMTLDLLPADYRLDSVFSTVDPFLFQGELSDYFNARYDVTVFDTPPTMTGITRAACIVSDKIIIPADISRGTIAPTLYTLEQLKKLNKKGNVYLIGYKDTDKAGFNNDLMREFKDRLGEHYKGSIPKGATIPKTATDPATKWTAKKADAMTDIFEGVL